ncbi:hypothetical protein FZI91_03965 [Mycobacterium sp. CBMA271]|uniref:hypothetical protein n=1 Tax=unclassified Mycobacteroides TaxID=2618759 RepID=UPI0013221A15|nr:MULTISPECIES: hypothetical protein [unclassified Mycobacteroides]MUM18275.1 hypothetical protein [Mycobacteroides sp. CBMA 326]MUM20862.1 hypothetical protein [Mycobacteroides sp. CBMA 271]
MEKVVFVLRQPSDAATDEWAEHLRTDIADKVRALGVHGLTVCVHDAAVRAASLRLVTLDPPFAAAVSVWVRQSYGAEVGEIGTILAQSSAAAHGYLVAESVPLPSPAPEPGARSTGFTNIALLRRPVDMPFEAWRQQWQGVHTQNALDLQSTIGYEQNLVVRAVTVDAPEISAIVFEHFPTSALTDPLAWYDAADQQQLTARAMAMLDSVKAFGAHTNLDTIATSRYDLVQPF